MTETKITYLFGAGASVKALPTVLEMPKRIGETIEYLLGIKPNVIDFSYNNDQLLEKINSIADGSLKDFLAGLLWLKENTEAHASVDTYAKKLYVTKKYSELKKLKAALTSFFIVWQLIRLI